MHRVIAPVIVLAALAGGAQSALAACYQDPYGRVICERGGPYYGGPQYGPPPYGGPGYGPGPGYGGRYMNEEGFSPPSRRWRTWNGCPPRYTVQDGLCKPYRGY